MTVVVDFASVSAPRAGEGQPEGGSGVGRRRNYRKFIETQDFLLPRTVARLAAGEPLAQPMTRLERLTIAVAAAHPSHLLTIDSVLDRAAFMPELEKLKARIRRDRHRPLVYFGTVAASRRGGGGFHAHLLLWQSLHYNTWHRHIRELNLGSAHVDEIAPSNDPHGWPLRVVAYVAGQQQAVFHGDEHLRHRPKPKHARAWIQSGRPTLARYEPQLLVALDLAKSPAVTDQELYERVSRFSNKEYSRNSESG